MHQISLDEFREAVETLRSFWVSLVEMMLEGNI